MEVDPEGHRTEDPRAGGHRKAQEENHADPEEHLGHPVACLHPEQEPEEAHQDRHLAPVA